MIAKLARMTKPHDLPLVRLERVSRVFDDGTIVALRSIDLAIKE